MLPLLLALLPLANGAQFTADTLRVYSGARGELDVTVPRYEQDIEVDGFLDEAAWTGAAVLTGFSQYQPVDGLPAADSTEVLVWYSSTAIYFGVRAFEPHGEVNATLADRDNIQGDDHIQLLLDTFNDGRRALVFAANPLGIQSDGARVEQGAVSAGLFGTRSTDPVDLSPDYLYDSQGRLTEYGYEIEFRIPLRSLSYQAKDRQSWGINIIRRVQHSGHEQTWTPARQGRASFLSQSGRLNDLRGLHRGLVLDINPVLTSSMDGTPTLSGWDYETRSPEFGTNVRWGVTSNLTLNATINPDFSQVEADVAQTSFDPRRAVFIPEKRPFFLDGREQFQTPNRLIFTRRIVSPVAAVKLTGKLSGTQIAFLSALDGTDVSATGSHPVINLLRLKRDLGDESTVGIAYTDRVEGSDFNRLASVDSRLVFGGVYDLRLQGAMSFDRRSASTTRGHLWDASLRRQGRAFGFNLLFKGSDRDLIAGSGFLSRVGTVQINASPNLTFFGESGAWMERYQLRLNLDATWLHDTFFAGEGPDDAWKIHVANSFVLRGGWRVGATVLVEKFFYPPDLYADYAIERRTEAGIDTIPFVGTPELMNYDLVLSMNTPNSNHFSGSASLILGQDENFDEWANARVVFVNADLTWRPTEQLRIVGRYVRQQYIRPDGGGTVRVRDIPRIKVEYQLSREVFFRFVGQYDATNVDDLRDDGRTFDPILVRDGDGVFQRAVGFSSNDVRVDWLFSFEPTPGTVIFAGYGATMTEDASFRFRNLNRTQDGFFVKLSYVFRP